MNSLSLSTIFNSDILSDCTLDLVDENSTTTLNVHKIILYLGCPYFRSMFGEFKESNQSNITLEVPNVQATCDIIQSFYGTKIINNNNNWEYELNLFMCKRFFCIDTIFPHQIKIPSDEFEEFLTMIEKIGFDKDIKKFIIKNIPGIYDFDKLLDLINKLDCDYNKCVRLMAKYISEPYDFNKLLNLINKLECDYDKRVRLVGKYIPKTYDFNNLSMGLIQDLWKIVDTYYIVLFIDNSINIINPKGIVHRTIKNIENMRNAYYSGDKHWIAFCAKNKILVYDIELDDFIFEKKINWRYILNINIIENRLMIHKSKYVSKLKFYDINNGNLINSLVFKNKYITNIFIDDKENKLIVMFNDKEDNIIYVYNLNTLEFLEKIVWVRVNSSRFSIYRKSMIALYTNIELTNNLFLLDFRKKGSCSSSDYFGSKQKIYNGTSNIVGICWRNYGFIIYCCEDGTINIFNIFKNKLKRTINIGKTINTMTKISNNRIMIKSGSELIEIDLDSGCELNIINIDPNVQSIMKISSGYERLYEFLPEP
ncbi:BTB POZ domain-containing [Acanthamoeba polyphaga mimivirus]|uniref:BTB POZ domain-containing n=1 Tax=Acanthamoeba polyphaga mimivirus TaxID=212035 RepID=A0A2L2DKW0_MIMIV|nr:BTB POZ domain-containing [Acanthamoeba polyphaga mimivirus]